MLGGVAPTWRNTVLQPPSVGEAGGLLHKIRVTVRAWYQREGEGEIPIDRRPRSP